MTRESSQLEATEVPEAARVGKATAKRGDELNVAKDISWYIRFAFRMLPIWRSSLAHTNQELLFRYYRELVTQEQAAKWWSIQPAVQANLVAIKA